MLESKKKFSQQDLVLFEHEFVCAHCILYITALCNLYVPTLRLPTTCVS